MRPRFGGVMFNGAPPRAKCLTYGPVKHRDHSGIHFDVDGRFTSDVRVDWSQVGGLPTEEEIDVLNVALVTLVAQFALPLRIIGPTVGGSAAAGVVADITRMLYDIRTFCDETRSRPLPEAAGASIGLPMADAGLSSRRRALVLLSGGFDSSLALIVLREAGYEVEALHVRTNRHVEEPEEVAARHVANRLGVRLWTVGLAAPDQEAMGRYYSRTFGLYPFYNSVPHGRDFPLAVIAAICARRLGCGAIAFGHEKESRGKVIRTHGRSVFRHDVESTHGADLVRQFIRRGLNSDVALFSPIAGASVYRVRATVLRHFPDLVPHLQFCFWGRRCEKCLKCVSTYLMQRHLGVQAIAFDQNPLADRDDKDMALLARPDRPSEALGYGPQMHYAMLRILQAGQDLPEDFWLHEFRKHGLRQVEADWSRIESICVDLDRPQEVPSDVQPVLEGLSLQ